MGAVAGSFVVLHHRLPPEHARPTHFDLMLEAGPTLRTWALSCWPLPEGVAVEACELAPHRRAYLSYEGPVSGNRGEVRRVAAGRYQQLSGTEAEFEVRLEAPPAVWTLRLARSADDLHRWRVMLVTAEAVRKS